ncbi:ABC-2 family transporter protein [Micromonospora pattaloongensis]|uniref:ABC-2 family transporter protein n=1 Tax=Micromonospora pattaloongensis TaxID=405436 RepID=A0A1H3H3I9_9ACTN|nr:ABC transporter permease subunit [Micromonospora pattaloongensis]SDY09314.1 ABC-2 family transporter protein [Micromonospora pattaloongensis]
MSLFKAEFRRLLKRRFVRYMTLGGLLVLIAVAVGTFATNHKIGPAEFAAAEQQAEQQYRENVRWATEEKKQCEQAKASGNFDANRFPADCSQISPAPRDAFEARWFLPSTFDFRRQFEDMITAWAAILALVAFVAGASFIGAEWSTGGMMNLLLWRPQRLRVLLTKLGALLTGLLGVALVTAAAWVGAFWAIASLRGTTEKTTSGVWQSFGLTGLRGLAVVLVAGAVGFALASLGRHTAMALGGALGVMVVGQFGLGIVLNMAGVTFAEAWLLPTYLLAWMQKKVVLQDWDACNATYTGECKPATMEIVWQDGGTLLAVGLALTLGAALWMMRRRDVA